MRCPNANYCLIFIKKFASDEKISFTITTFDKGTLNVIRGRTGY